MSHVTAAMAVRCFVSTRGPCIIDAVTWMLPDTSKVIFDMTPLSSMDLKWGQTIHCRIHKTVPIGQNPFLKKIHTFAVSSDLRPKWFPFPDRWRRTKCLSPNCPIRVFYSRSGTASGRIFRFPRSNLNALEEFLRCPFSIPELRLFWRPPGRESTCARCRSDLPVGQIHLLNHIREWQLYFFRFCLPCFPLNYYEFENLLFDGCFSSTS